jgi:hypothetical protein
MTLERQKSSERCHNQALKPGCHDGHKHILVQEGETAGLTCPKGNTIYHIEFADYGYPTWSKVDGELIPADSQNLPEVSDEEVSGSSLDVLTGVGNGWVTTATEADAQSWTADLQTEYLISQIVVDWERNLAVRDYTILSSTDGNDWVMRFQKRHMECVSKSQSATGEVRQDALAWPSSSTARFVRIIVKNACSPAHQFRLKKVELFKPGQNCDARFRSEKWCSTNFAKHLVRHSCRGKQQCAIPADSKLFGDPCGGVRKMLAITYHCRNQPQYIDMPTQLDHAAPVVLACPEGEIIKNVLFANYGMSYPSTFEILEGLTCTGEHKLALLQTETVQDCQNACRKSATCRGYTFQKKMESRVANCFQ